MSKETTLRDCINYFSESVCSKCKYYNKAYGVCNGEILPIERAILRNLGGFGNCKDIKDFAKQLKE